MEAETQGGWCSLEEQLAVPVASPNPVVERSDAALENGSSSSLSAVCERPGALPAPAVFAARSALGELDEEWMGAEGDMLHDLLWTWDAVRNADAKSSISSDSPEFTFCGEGLAVEPSTELAITKIRAPKTLAAKPFTRKPGPGSGNPKRTATMGVRQKLEIQSLRAHALDLSEKLKRLKKAARIAKTMESSSRTDFQEGLSLWKAIAGAQHDHLEQEQRENQQLKLDVLSFKEITKNLRRSLLKRTNMHELLATVLQLPPHHSSLDLDLSPDDRKIFQSMLSDTNAMCESIGNALELLQTKTRATHAGSFRRWDLRRDASMALFAEMVNCEELPFRRAQVENAMRVLRDREKPGAQRYDAHLFGGSPEVVLVKTRFRYSGRHESGIYRARKASRSFEDETHSYSVSIMYIDTIDASGNSAPGFLFKTQTWTILTEQLRSSGEGEGPTTLLQTYSTLAPVLIREPFPVRWEKEIAEKYVIPEWDQSISAGHQALENALLDLANRQVDQVD